MKKTSAALMALAMAAGLSGCAYQASPVDQLESPASTADQAKAQAEAQKAADSLAPTLKRKVALGRIANDTSYGRSLLSSANPDEQTKQVYNIDREAARNGSSTQQVGADILVIGSLTEFGRKTVGKSGFMSATKKQVAYAKIDVRVVDTSTGIVLFTASGAGEASNESGSVLGWGSSRASYDGTLSDKAIAQAVSEVINKMVTGLADRPWKTYFLSVEKGAVAISGGASQGLTPGMKLSVKTLGKQVKSGQTGFLVRLPGTEIAKIEVTQNFGDSPETEGSLVKVISGSLGKHDPNKLVIEEIK